MENATPEVILTGSAAIKLFIDLIAGLIPEGKRKRIPVVALVLGLAWAILLFWGELSDAIYRGLTIGAWAIGVNEAVGIGKKKE